MQADRQIRSLNHRSEGSILALVPFGAPYTASRWARLEQRLPAALVDNVGERLGLDEAAPPQLQRTIDLDAPTAVLQGLYESIRLTDFCLVDLVGANPNVLFELGIRLAANPVSPVVIDDFSADSSVVPIDHQRQLHQLRTLLHAIDWTENPGDCRLIVDHFRAAQSAANGGGELWSRAAVPDGAVFDLVWRFARPEHERDLAPVHLDLRTAAERLLPDRETGRAPFVYPTSHDFSRSAVSAGLDRLVAAWAYVRLLADVGLASAEVLDAEATLTNDLLAQLEYAGRTDDPLHRLATESQSGRQLAAFKSARDLIAFAGRIRGTDPHEAFKLLDWAVSALRHDYDAAVAAGDQGATVRAAVPLADALGRRGGVLRSLDDPVAAMASYADGARFEINFDLSTTYCQVNGLALRWRHESDVDLLDDTSAVFARLRVQLDGDRRDDFWGWADAGQLAALLADDEGMVHAYRRFAELPSQPPDYETVRAVLCELQGALTLRGSDRATAIARAIQVLDDAIRATYRRDTDHRSGG